MFESLKKDLLAEEVSVTGKDGYNNHNKNNNSNNRNNNHNNNNKQKGTVFLQLAKIYSKRTPNVKEKEIKSLMEKEYDKFLSNYKWDYDNNKFNHYYENALKDEIFVKSFVKETKKRLKEGKEINPVINMFLGLFLVKNFNLIDSDESVESLYKLYSKLNIKYISKIEKVIKLDSQLSIAIPLVIQNYDGIDIKRNNTVYNFIDIMNTFSSELIEEYVESRGDKTDTQSFDDLDYSKLEKKIKKLFKLLFKKNKIDFITLILLEKKSNYRTLDITERIMWNRITNVILKELNKMDKKEIKTVLINYGDMRKVNGKGIERRIRLLSSIDPEDYSNVVKVAKKIIKKNPKYKELLD